MFGMLPVMPRGYHQLTTAYNSTAKYPIRPVDNNTYSIPQGVMSHMHENLFLGMLPKRLIFWCIDKDACNGEYSKNPFNAKNKAINFLAVYFDGRQVPAKLLLPNFDTGSYIRSYANLLSATGKQAQDEGNELLRDEFGKGYTFFGFELIPDGCDGGCFHFTRTANLRIEMHFATALEQTVNVISTVNLRQCSRSTKVATSPTTNDGDRSDITTSGTGPADVSLQNGR